MSASSTEMPAIYDPTGVMKTRFAFESEDEMTAEINEALAEVFSSGVQTPV